MSVEFEIYKLTSTTIYNMLKERIRGYIKVYVEDDVLNVCIVHDNITFDYTYKNFMDYIHMNGNKEAIVEDVIKHFRRCINNKCFY